MKIYSKTHTITDKASLAVETPLDARGKPVSKTAVVNHPAGTVLDMDDDAAQSLIDQGFATEYKAEDHKDAPKGKVIVERVQTQTSLPDGATQPNVVRQDGTLNDVAPGRPKGAEVLFDAKDADKLEKEHQDELAAARLAQGDSAAAAAAAANAGKLPS